MVCEVVEIGNCEDSWQGRARRPPGNSDPSPPDVGRTEVNIAEIRWNVVEPEHRSLSIRRVTDTQKHPQRNTIPNSFRAVSGIDFAIIKLLPTNACKS